jgi:hypothetical protein
MSSHEIFGRDFIKSQLFYALGAVVSLLLIFKLGRISVVISTCLIGAIFLNIIEEISKRAKDELLKRENKQVVTIAEMNDVLSLFREAFVNSQVNRSSPALKNLSIWFNDRPERIANDFSYVVRLPFPDIRRYLLRNPLDRIISKVLALGGDSGVVPAQEFLFATIDAIKNELKRVIELFLTIFCVLVLLTFAIVR